MNFSRGPRRGRTNPGTRTAVAGPGRAGFSGSWARDRRSGSARLAGSARDIAAICIRLSSFLCCGLASHVRGEAVTQLSSLSPRPSLASAADQGLLSILSIYLPLRCLFFSFSMSFPFLPVPAASPPAHLSVPLDGRPGSFDFKPPRRRGPYTLSSLPCQHSCIQLHGAALMHFVRNARSPLSIPAKPGTRGSLRLSNLDLFMLLRKYATSKIQNRKLSIPERLLIDGKA